MTRSESALSLSRTLQSVSTDLCWEERELQEQILFLVPRAHHLRDFKQFDNICNQFSLEKLKKYYYRLKNDRVVVIHLVVKAYKGEIIDTKAKKVKLTLKNNH